MSSNGIACNIAFSAWWTCGFSSCGCGSGRRSASGEQAFHSQNGSWLSFGRLHISKSNSMGWCVHATLRLAMYTRGPSGVGSLTGHGCALLTGPNHGPNVQFSPQSVAQ